ncbi:disks large-associated protein 5 isoform X2 [Hemicordylus capensis]|uniref:disks large-associated protein 5 isoform X2 n=1 Tax=Hemicordylus capensis TaxID=884348 RepID=UPI00230473FE|nr:disks large-associated protein 5 isoform X2 [Hemicordylus capensis]
MSWSRLRGCEGGWIWSQHPLACGEPVLPFRINKMATNFATLYKKDLSTNCLKTKLVRRKSIRQKENRYIQFNKGRQFGLIDVNTQPSRDRELSCLEETDGIPSPKNKTKPIQTGNVSVKTRGQARIEMLQRYKAEKELRKLKEQRDKPLFKVGRYKPENPSFLPPTSQIPVLSKTKEKVAAAATALPVRETRSKAKNQLEGTSKLPARPQPLATAPNYTSKGCGLQPAQHRQKQSCVDKPPPKERKGVQPSAPPTTNGRITRSTAAALTRIPRASQMPTTAGNLSQKRVTNKGKQQKEIKNESEMALHDMKENTLEPVKREDNSYIPLSVDNGQDEAFLEKENMPASRLPDPAPPKRNRSFAPQNFLFKPLEGLATYKVKPMTPSRANVFLSPNLTWSPTKTTSKDTKETRPLDCPLRSQSSPIEEITENLPECQPALESLENEMESAVGAISCGSETSLQPVVPPVTETPEPAPAGELQHDVPYFRNILQSETERLTSHCLEWDGTAEMDIPEDAKDLVRTTVGQTRLLISERFKQFEGLVDNCEFRRGEKETTCGDLDGFWDMVNFQVQDVNKKFENLRKLQENGWQIAADVLAKRPARKASQRATKAKDGSAERTAARKRLAAIKALMKNQMKQDGVATEAAGPAMPWQVEKVTFDGGFFQVESPAKTFAGRTPKSTGRTPRRISTRTTPRSASRTLLQSCADTCVVRLGTPVVSNSVPPQPDLNTCLTFAGADHLSCIPEQSDTQAAEEPCAMTEDTAEEPNEAQTTTSDRGSPSKEMNGSVSVRSQELENPESNSEVPDAEEDEQQMDADLGGQDVLCSPKRDSPFEGTCDQGGELHTPGCKTGSLLGDFFSCDEMELDLRPIPDSSLVFTPLRNEAERFAATAVYSDLITFSPLPDGEK